MEYYLIVKKSKLLIHTIWMNLQRIVLSERKPTLGKLTYSVIPSIYYSLNEKIVEWIMD